MAYEDPYVVLGVQRGAKKQDVQKTFRELALKHHPDKDPSLEAAQKFQRISRAATAILKEVCASSQDRWIDGGQWGFCWLLAGVTQLNYRSRCCEAKVARPKSYLWSAVGAISKVHLAEILLSARLRWSSCDCELVISIFLQAWPSIPVACSSIHSRD